MFVHAINEEEIGLENIEPTGSSLLGVWIAPSPIPDSHQQFAYNPPMRPIGCYAVVSSTWSRLSPSSDFSSHFALPLTHGDLIGVVFF